ncbi:hypothetical protein [Micromonospora sp. NPDC051006]|uniref:hypothetical protein n=1 Tax=Micromonospora sp. NPDC051006 TaxID=3364283 RepID=UPI0037885FCD
MARLSEITFRLPDTPVAHAFLTDLRTLLADVPYASAAVGRLTLTPPRPDGARPETTFLLADVPEPEIALDTGQTIGVGGGAAPDEQGPPAGIELAELARRLAGHVPRVDHTGVNLPTCAVRPEQWQSLVAAVASTATMYRYPTGEPWPFVLPSTAGELQHGIADFVVGREPRFELVHDPWRTYPEWQFALWTDLTRAQLELLFPDPQGMTAPGLEDIFRVVPIRSPWSGLGIRFDLCYRIDDGPSDWETGEWLVRSGGRIPPTQ